MNFYDSKAHEILTESVWQRLDEDVRVYLNEWDEVINLINESEHSLNFLMLSEATLEPDQIQALFKSAEAISAGKDAGPSSETNKDKEGKAPAGKVIDGVKLGGAAISKINKKINDVAQKAIQIRFGEGETLEQKLAKFDKIINDHKTKIYDHLSDKPKIKAAVDNLVKAAKGNPVKAALAVGVLTVVVAAMTGAAGGVVAGLVLRTGLGMMKGENFTKAAAKSLKTAAVGGLVGGLSDLFSGDEVLDVNVSEPEIIDGEPAGVYNIESTDGPSASNTAELLADTPVEDYKLAYAEELASQSRYGDFSDAMIQKMADNVTVTGDYPNDFESSFSGQMLRGDIYMTSEEMANWQQFLSSNNMDGMDTLSNEATEWLKANVEGADEQMSAQQSAAATAQADRYDSMTPEQQAQYDDEQEDY